MRAAFGLLVGNQVERRHAVPVLGVEVGTMFHEDHQHGLPTVEGRQMKRGLVLVVFLIDVVAE